MDLLAERIREPPELDYCPAEGLGSKLEPKLLDAVTGRHHDGSPGGLVVSLLLLLWPVSFLLATLCLICVVCKVYSRLTLGRCFSNADMSGRTVLITGANAGIGKETAKELARRNARVILACRDTSRAAAAAREIYRETGREVVLRRLDLCSFKSIREFADDIIAGEERLDVLINNAGIVPFPERVETVDGFEQTFQTNHLGPFLLTNLLLGKLKASAPSRIITLSSLLHHFGRVDPSRLEYSDYKVPMQVYSDTKLANILFTKELARRLQGTGVTANVLHPGAVQTDINSTYVGFLNIFMNGLFYFFGKSPAEGAQTSIFLAVSDEVRKVSGKYFMDCRLSMPSRTSEDAELARKLWAVSEKMTGLAI
ncbi:retinol dehydrogenase 11-like isoform X1 [Ixodes scapularis]|uniref:retinol dehydrogenase 11-like isoform X1 n=1 Tax=Ixodes scapularis TaxID=6945 RepID=UPI001A9CE8BB|nr:retinol dehydrogenase 11-like isoform X1 [Ixodes scapularis]